MIRLCQKKKTSNKQVLLWYTMSRKCIYKSNTLNKGKPVENIWVKIEIRKKENKRETNRKMLLFKCNRH